MSQRYEIAKEQITNILIQEYCKQNPGVRENEVIVKCQDGVLIFSDMASVLAEMKIRKDFQKALENAGKMYSTLAAHENQRWNDCIESTEHSKMMVDCLHSSPFHHYSPLEWQEMHNYFNNQEQICAKATVRLEECKRKLAELKKQGVKIQSSRGRTVIIEYLNWVIDQLKVVHRVFKKEVEIGDVFAKKAKVFIDVKFQSLDKRSTHFRINMDDLNKLFKSLKGSKRESLELENVGRLNVDILMQTKRTLAKSVDEMKGHLQKRREQFQEIWSAISHMRSTVEAMEEMNRMEEEGKLVPEPVDVGDTTPVQRMARYTQSLRNLISQKKNK